MHLPSSVESGSRGGFQHGGPAQQIVCPSTSALLTLAQPGTVTLSLYDLNGRKVGDLVAGEQRAPGRHTVSLNARNMASGTYLYILEAASSGKTYREARRMTLIK